MNKIAVYHVIFYDSSIFRQSKTYQKHDKYRLSVEKMHLCFICTLPYALGSLETSLF